MSQTDQLAKNLAALNVKILTFEDLDGRDPGIDEENFGAQLATCPKSLNDVRKIVTWCAGASVSIVPQGGRTGLAGGAVTKQGQLIMMLDRMNTIRHIDVDAAIAIVDAGVTLSQLEDAVNEHGLTVGIDIAARGTCTIGGMVATNAGGGEAFRNGIMRNRVLGLEAVLPNGTVMSDLKQVIKANEGYDVKQLLIGSEGTLGIVTGVVLKLEPATSQRDTILAAVPNISSALAYCRRLRRAFGADLLAAEIMGQDFFSVTSDALGFNDHFGHLDGDVFVVVDVHKTQENDQLLDVLAASLEAGEINDAILAKNEQERKNIWLVREDTFLINDLFPDGCWFDISIPLAKLDEFERESRARLHKLDPDLRIFFMGHLGDGNLHYTIAKETSVIEMYDDISAVLYQGLTEMGGSFSAEHGIGTDKREALSKYGDAGKIEMMKAIKRAIDPQNIMNPNKVINAH
ncbi:hypothetical protein RB2150_01714 [Rhodobacteraceae bacterium HTCC2150]|nr:hypothetical protein RB2150_01714 [Rhodobacteraceae bacterium HTCC2150]